MFSFLHLLYTGDFKADGWVLITVEAEELCFCLDATAKVWAVEKLPSAPSENVGKFANGLLCKV